MAKPHEPEEIMTKLRQVVVLVSQGSSVADAIRGIAANEVTPYRITSVPTMSGFLYLAVVLDAFSRRIVGWST